MKPCPPGMSQGEAEARQGQALLNFPAYSQVIFRATLDTNVYTIAAQELQFFSYGVGQSCEAAGYASGVTANESMTNLSKAGETPWKGAEMAIYGIAMMPRPDAAPRILEHLFAHSSVKLYLNNKMQQYTLGPAAFCPGGGGLTGSAIDLLRSNSLDGIDCVRSFVTNGLPGADNYYRFPCPIYWRGDGRVDSDLRVGIQLHTAFSVTSASVAADLLEDGVGNPTKGYTQPANLAYGTHCGLWCQLIGQAVGERTQVS